MEKTQIDSNESGTNAEEKGNKAERGGYTAISRRYPQAAKRIYGQSPTGDGH